ncbi:type II toxin-antitoxin system RelE/ParE family toxin [Olsenella sp. Marseille-P4559]|uniref:type II toxin-antitoxin system RelE/ParE family toxin n=1 Tax=Olsenella sp. Marseille-P4559 TaxID=2364795 RepID=UPI001032738B|nr:type II toxin-antitoxin system RelE/ParE family toxin [Olsenella sp. Marseille-P4559]
MSAWRVRLTDMAVADIREAAAYMADQLANPMAADDFLDEVQAKVDMLKKSPESYARARDFDLAKAGYRWCPVGSFLMFFIADDTHHFVCVERVLFGARDWKSLL